MMAYDYDSMDMGIFSATFMALKNFLCRNRDIDNYDYFVYIGERVAERRTSFRDRLAKDCGYTLNTPDDFAAFGMCVKSFFKTL